MPTLLMRKIKPGYNDPEWSAELQCTGGCLHTLGNKDAATNACGATFQVPRAALYTASYSNDGAEEISFCCPECNVETPVTDGEDSFTNLPTREQWFAENRPKEGFVIKYQDGKFFTGMSAGWTRTERHESASFFPTREAAQVMIDLFTQMRDYIPKIVAFTEARS